MSMTAQPTHSSSTLGLHEEHHAFVHGQQDENSIHIPDHLTKTWFKQWAPCPSRRETSSVISAPILMIRQTGLRFLDKAIALWWYGHVVAMVATNPRENSEQCSLGACKKMTSHRDHVNAMCQTASLHVEACRIQFLISSAGTPSITSLSPKPFIVRSLLCLYIVIGISFRTLPLSLA